MIRLKSEQNSKTKYLYLRNDFGQTYTKIDAIDCHECAWENDIQTNEIETSMEKHALYAAAAAPRTVI
jgi:hypothetical protein